MAVQNIQNILNSVNSKFSNNGLTEDKEKTSTTPKVEATPVYLNRTEKKEFNNAVESWKESSKKWDDSTKSTQDKILKNLEDIADKKYGKSWKELESTLSPIEKDKFMSENKDAIYGGLDEDMAKRNEANAESAKNMQKMKELQYKDFTTPTPILGRDKHTTEDILNKDKNSEVKNALARQAPFTDEQIANIGKNEEKDYSNANELSQATDHVAFLSEPNPYATSGAGAKVPEDISGEATEPTGTSSADSMKNIEEYLTDYEKNNSKNAKTLWEFIDKEIPNPTEADVTAVEDLFKKYKVKSPEAMQKFSDFKNRVKTNVKEENSVVGANDSATTVEPPKEKTEEETIDEQIEALQKEIDEMRESDNKRNSKLIQDAQDRSDKATATYNSANAKLKEAQQSLKTNQDAVRNLSAEYESLNKLYKQYNNDVKNDAHDGYYYYKKGDYGKIELGYLSAKEVNSGVKGDDRFPSANGWKMITVGDDVNVLKDVSNYLGTLARQKSASDQAVKYITDNTIPDAKKNLTSVEKEYKSASNNLKTTKENQKKYTNSILDQKIKEQDELKLKKRNILSERIKKRDEELKNEVKNNGGLTTIQYYDSLIEQYENLLKDPNLDDETKKVLKNDLATVKVQRDMADDTGNQTKANLNTFNETQKLFTKAAKQIDDGYIEALPKTIRQAYKDGYFGDPKTDEAKKRYGYMLVNKFGSILGALSNAAFTAAGKTGKANDVSAWDKIQATELANGLERRQSKLKKITEDAQDQLKEYFKDDTKKQLVASDLLNDSRTKKFMTEQDVRMKGYLVEARIALGEDFYNYDPEKLAAWYAAYMADDSIDKNQKDSFKNFLESMDYVQTAYNNASSGDKDWSRTTRFQQAKVAGAILKMEQEDFKRFELELQKNLAAYNNSLQMALIKYQSEVSVEQAQKMISAVAQGNVDAATNIWGKADLEALGKAAAAQAKADPNNVMTSKDYLKMGTDLVASLCGAATTGVAAYTALK